MNKLQPHDVSPDVITLRQRLLNLGINVPYLNPEDVDRPEFFDDHVESAVMIFQQQRGLTVDGIVATEVLTALEEAQWPLGTRDFHSGTEETLRGDDVFELQKKLANLGFYQNNIDGIFGVATVKALKELQLSLGVEDTGLYDHNTVEALNRLNLTMSDSKANRLRALDEVSKKGSSLKSRTIIIDSHHKPHEAAITAHVAQKTAELIREFGGTVFVLDHQQSLSLNERENFALSHPADLYVSLCVEHLEQTAAHGFACFYCGNPKTGLSQNPVSEQFARILNREIAMRTQRHNLGVFARRWQILNIPKTPSVQLDLGYISNPEDEAFLCNEESLEKYAQGIAAAIQRIFLPIEKDQPTGSISRIELQQFNR